eukprot:m.90833 g.90833  ORF g.90833 m.90833 type:complete len:250 (+) comp11890_c0_seq2:55-804(+)
MATLGDGEGPAVGREAKVVTGYEAAMQANNELESHRVGLERWYTIHTPPTEALWREKGLLVDRVLRIATQRSMKAAYRGVTPILQSSYNEFYAYQWVNGYPSFRAIDEDGDERRIWREGDTWYTNWHGDFSIKRMCLKHAEGGDVNVPPPLPWSWHVDEGGSPNFRLSMCTQTASLLETRSECTPRNFRFFSLKARTRVVALFLCNCRLRKTGGGGLKLPLLPEEMWLAILVNLTQRQFLTTVTEVHEQ